LPAFFDGLLYGIQKLIIVKGLGKEIDGAFFIACTPVGMSPRSFVELSLEKMLRRLKVLYRETEGTQKS
jgi:hypothetical protein